VQAFFCFYDQSLVHLSHLQSVFSNLDAHHNLKEGHNRLWSCFCRILSWSTWHSLPDMAGMQPWIHTRVNVFTGPFLIARLLDSLCW